MKKILLERIKKLPKAQRALLNQVTWEPIESGVPGPMQTFTYTNGTLIPASTTTTTSSNIANYFASTNWTWGETKY